MVTHKRYRNAAEIAFDAMRAVPDPSHQRMIAFLAARRKAEDKLPKEEQQRLARARLVADGIIRELPDGSAVLHKNYGGPDEADD